LVRAGQVEYVRDRWNPKRWRGCFHDAAGHKYQLKVTDAIVCDRLGRGEQISPECILTISLIEPWAPEGGSKPAMCYKLIAAVIELK
jgi:hypothetical protein